MKRPTMKDVARAAGVSPMTVSRAVSGEPGVSPDTAARVEQAIRQLGYQRNDNARNLRQKNLRTSTIGLVVDDLANPFYALMARSVEDEAHRRGFLVLVGSTNDEPRREREVIAAFTARQVDGLILVPTNGGHGFLKQPMEGGTCVVCVDRPAKGLAVDTVTVDNRAGAERAVSHLLGHGHTRIAYLGDRFDIWTQRERHAGYLDALASHGIAEDPALVRHGLRSQSDAAAALAELRALPGPPTALFTTNDLISIGVMDGLGRPDPVALVGFDDFPLADRLSPPLSVVSQDPVALGATAANLLFSRIDGDLSAPRSVVLLTRLIVRGSGSVGGVRG
ncbi:LacI family DNA-binding transcriptional regulator [Streptomyces violascens]|uniref:LacI family transcriptional regulator n=1 Tax=Streptomyces violascens TaxID=67381 RepID=A0ABQ3QFM7_9ACTN|nr:LacI family DNA-binding transcriptional regulator [Streptomyces violascens]GGT87446.1 LacI family transcriptional regulator [Streptomyces violascens]GHI36088.1 LacI family transcriptional regulator [Streptomyces violascens]